jgi:hypothetical protein
LVDAMMAAETHHLNAGDSISHAVGRNFETREISDAWLRRVMKTRHCERSEAIHTVAAETVWIASSGLSFF